MKTNNIKNICTLLLALVMPALLHADRFYCPVALTYAHGIFDVADKLDDLYTQAGYDFDKEYVIPVGLSVSPYYEFDCGLGVGVSVGPTAIIAIEDETSSHDDDVDVSYIVPIGADLRYTFFRDKDCSPYVRVGVRYPIVGGPNLDSSEPGPFGMVGVDIWRTKRIGMGVEVGYDASRVKVEGPTGKTKEITFPGFMASVFVRF